MADRNLGYADLRHKRFLNPQTLKSEYCSRSSDAGHKLARAEAGPGKQGGAILKPLNPKPTLTCKPLNPKLDTPKPITPKP